MVELDPLDVIRAEVSHIPDAFVPDLIASRLVLLDAAGLEDRLAAATGEIQFRDLSWRVRSFTGELSLRRSLVECSETRVIAVYLGAAGAFVLPMDIRARAFHGEMRPVTERSLLCAATGFDWPPLFEDGAWAPLAWKYLDRLHEAVAAGGPGVLTEQGCAEVVARAWLGRVNLAASPEEYLASGILRGDDAPVLRLEADLISSRAAQTFDEPFAGLIDWGLNNTGGFEKAFVAMLKVHAFCHGSSAPSPSSWYGLDPLWTQLTRAGGQPESVRQRWTQQLSEMAVRLVKLLDPAFVQPHLGAVEQEFIDQGLCPHGSPLFRRDYDQAKTALFHALRDRAAIDQAQADACLQHPAAGSDRERSLLEHLIRVRRWLDSAPRPDPSQPWPASDALEWYWSEGAWADLEVQRAWYLIVHHLPASSDARKAWESVWDVAGEQRDLYNERFVQTIRQDYKNQIHQGSVVNTSKFLDWIVAPLIEQGARILLVVEDGLSVPLFHYLHESMSSASLGIGKERRLGCSLLPSITSVSRKAIFMGRMPAEDTMSEEEYETRSTQAEPQQLAKYATDHHFKAAYFRGDVAKARDALADPSCHLVAVVLNTFDEALKQHEEGPDLRTLNEADGLGPLIEAALQNGRRVYLTSDHGHTLIKPRLGVGTVQGASARYFTGATSQAGNQKVGSISDANVPGAANHPVHFLHASGAYFGSKTRGTHGGCSLEEMAVPLVEIVRSVTPPERPAWWEVSSPATHPAPTEPSPSGGLTIVLPDESHRTLPINPAVLASEERHLLLQLARRGSGNAADLGAAAVVLARRVSAHMASLQTKLARAGLKGLVESKGRGLQGEQFEFHAELLPHQSH